MPIHILKTHAFHADEREARIIFKRKKKDIKREFQTFNILDFQF